MRGNGWDQAAPDLPTAAAGTAIVFRRQFPRGLHGWVQANSMLPSMLLPLSQSCEERATGPITVDHILAPIYIVFFPSGVLKWEP